MIATYRWQQALDSSLAFTAEIPKGAIFRTAAFLGYGSTSIVAQLANAPLVPIINLIFSYDPTVTEKQPRTFQIVGGRGADLPAEAIYLWTLFEPPMKDVRDLPEPFLIYETTAT